MLYEPLDRSRRQIRLFRLQQPRDDGQIRGVLQTFNVADKPVFMALSYAWGKEEYKHILVSGYELQVRTNLYDFLEIYEARPELSTSTWIWIDQICIDQNAIGERNHQVGIMDQIYLNAKHTIIWLGLDPHAGLAAATIAELVDYMDRIQSETESYDDPIITEDNPILQGVGLEAMCHLLESNYFTRHWIVQEIVLSDSPAFWYGRSRIFWADLHNIVVAMYVGEYQAIMWEPLYLVMDLVFCLEMNEGMDEQSRHALSWNCAMQVAAGTKCCDLRDKIYGIQSILGPALRIDVDYTLSPREVFLKHLDQVTQFLARLDRRLSPGFSYAEAVSALAASMGFKVDRDRLWSLVVDFSKTIEFDRSGLYERKLIALVMQHVVECISLPPE